MKKIMTSLFAVAAVFCASAANPGYSVSPADSTVVDNRNDFKVTFSFDSPVKIQHVEFIGGERFNSKRTLIDKVTPEAVSQIVVNVPDSVWGTPSGGNYYLEVILPEIYDAEGNQYKVEGIDPDTGDKYEYAYTASAFYSSPTGEAVEYKGLDPDPATTTVWNVYNDGYGFSNFLFSGEVGLTENSKAEVFYILEDEIENNFMVGYQDLWADWDFWTGFYAITVPMQVDSEVTEESLKGIRVNLYNVKVGSETKNYEANYALITTPNERRINKQASSKLSVAVANASTVYDIYGNVICEDGSIESIKNLPAGIYIMDGKKYVVR